MVPGRLEGMKGDIALAGFVITAAEWRELDPVARAQLMAAVLRRDDPWIAHHASAPDVLADGDSDRMAREIGE